MKIVELTNVTKSQEISVTKGIGSLIIATTKSLHEIDSEKISIYIERANGSNIYLANKVPLLDFILASTYGNEAVQSEGTQRTIALCELALDGSIFLADKEQIKIQLEDLELTTSYVLNGIEEPASTDKLYFFEQKTIASEEFNKKLDISGFDLAVMTKKPSLQDISYTFENQKVVKYNPFELQTLSSNVDPITSIDKEGTVQQRLADRLVLPLVHVDYIEINKSQGEVINFVVRNIREV